jgi:hypothetical protein
MRRTALTTLAVLASVAFRGRWAETSQHMSFVYQGTDRQMSCHRRMYVDYNHGTSRKACSLQCTAQELALMIDRTPKSLMVAVDGPKKTERLGQFHLDYRRSKARHYVQKNQVSLREQI